MPFYNHYTKDSVVSQLPYNKANHFTVAFQKRFPPVGCPNSISLVYNFQTATADPVPWAVAPGQLRSGNCGAFLLGYIVIGYHIPYLY